MHLYTFKKMCTITIHASLYQLQLDKTDHAVYKQVNVLQRTPAKVSFQQQRQRLRDHQPVVRTCVGSGKAGPQRDSGGLDTGVTGSVGLCGEQTSCKDFCEVLASVQMRKRKVTARLKLHVIHHPDFSGSKAAAGFATCLTTSTIIFSFLEDLRQKHRRTRTSLPVHTSTLLRNLKVRLIFQEKHSKVSYLFSHQRQ